MENERPEKNKKRIRRGKRVRQTRRRRVSHLCQDKFDLCVFTHWARSLV